jgi:RND family efflux transporter MFP subunit
MNPQLSDEQKTLLAASQAGGPAAPPPLPPRETRGHGPWNVLLIIVLLIALGEAAYIFRNRLPGLGKPTSDATSTGERKILYWQCSMHPEVKSDKPGKCPICGMDLVPIYAAEAKPASASQERKILYWQDAMNPDRHYDKPGKAPDGMDLVPVYAESQGAGGKVPEGAFKIAPEKQQLIGVQYGEATLQPVARSIRAVARLAYDETRIARIHSKVEGWIDRVYVDFTGMLVEKNRPLLAVYSPDLVATQDEYLLALRARDKLGQSSFKEVAEGANSLLDAARKRLELWDISDQQIDEVEKTRQPIRALTLYSPVSGFVIARNAYEKQRITPETELYSIADLSTVWALADFYEYEVHDLRVGQAIALTLPSFPGRTFRGAVDYIYPQLDSSTRTLEIRAKFPNPDFALKPGMYANVDLKIDYGSRLVIPREAVLNSGAEQRVFVALDGGYFEPRKVVLGDSADNRVIVLSGLKAGERVVTSGNFLIDSESNLKSAASGMGMPGMGGGAATETQPRKPPKKDGAADHSTHPMKPERNSHD